MIGILVVTHDILAQALISAAEMILGPQEKVEGLCVEVQDNLETLTSRISSSIEALEGDGVLILVDLFGGTPANAALSTLRDNSNECVCGANLPMLIEVLTSRDECTLQQLAMRALDAGRRGIVDERSALANATHDMKSRRKKRR